MDLNDAEKLARWLMDEHGLKSWTFVYNSRLRTTFGMCHSGSRQISLNPHLTEVNNEYHTTNMILHEIAHALCKVRGHGRAWRRVARRVGAEPRATYAEDVIIPKHLDRTPTDRQHQVLAIVRAASEREAYAEV